MKKMAIHLTVIILLLSVLFGFSGCKRSPRCAYCNGYVAPMHRILNGGGDFYLCGNCCAVGFEFGVVYRRIKGSCYFCKNETT